MPWSDSSLNSLIEKMDILVYQEFSIHINAKVYITSRPELIEEVVNEFQTLNYSKNQIEFEKRYTLPKILGKYFKKRNEIWLVNEDGTNIDVLVHEALHSIQKCTGKREPIVDLITYKLTGNNSYITDFEDWYEIEKTSGWEQIKRKLISTGNCEEF